MERVYIIPLRDVKKAPRTIRSAKAIRIVREFLQRHMKSDDIKIAASVNEKIWERGIQKTPSKIKVKAVTEEDGSVSVTLVE